MNTYHFFRGADLRCIFYLLLEKIASFWTDAIICINQEDFFAAKRFKLSSAQVFMPGIGIDRQKYIKSSEDRQRDVRQKLGLGDSKCLIMIADFNPGKRHVDLLSAFQKINRKDVFLLLAGNGPLFDAMKKLAVELGINERVKFLGVRDDIVDLLSISSINILPSIREGLPRSILEAMSVGVACIGSDVRGIRDLLEDDSGGLFPPKNVEELAIVIDKVLSDEPLRLKWIANAQEKLARYEIGNIVKMHEELYQSLLMNA